MMLASVSGRPCGALRIARVVSAIFVCVAGSAASQPSVRVHQYDAPATSHLWIEGGSNVRDWACQARKFDAQVSVDSVHEHDDEPSLGAEHVKRVSVKVAVRDLTCGNRHMERDLYHALKADDPNAQSFIIGVFDALRVPEEGASYIDTEGTITVAGVQKGTRLRIIMERRPDGTIEARGSVPLLMTDFGVTPPTGLFGLIRSHNEITVRFAIAVSQADSRQ
jgi:polyisoprenoid-binding protein YceI